MPEVSGELQTVLDRIIEVNGKPYDQIELRGRVVTMEGFFRQEPYQAQRVDLGLGVAIDRHAFTTSVERDQADVQERTVIELPAAHVEIAVQPNEVRRVVTQESLVLGGLDHAIARQLYGEVATSRLLDADEQGTLAEWLQSPLTVPSPIEQITSLSDGEQEILRAQAESAEQFNRDLAGPSVIRRGGPSFNTDYRDRDINDLNQLRNGSIPSSRLRAG